MTKPGRKPQGDKALTGPERQARYMARIRAAAPAAPKSRQPAKGPSRATQWAGAVTTLARLQGEYGASLDKLPEGLRNTPMGEALQAIVDLELDDLLAIVPPKGFGRD